MKIDFFSLIIFFSSINLWAENNPGVNLHFASGEQMVIQLEDEPMFTFENDDIVITTNKIILRFSSNELLKFTHVNIYPSSVENLETEKVRVCFTKDGIYASNLKPHSKFSVYSQDGKLVCSSLANENGTVNVSFHTHKGLVYIIKTDSIDFKIIKQ